MLEALVDTMRAALEGDKQSLLLIAAVYMLLVCGYSVLYQVRMSRWPGVSGKLRYLDIELFGARERALPNRQYHADALYEYRVDGRSYENSKISPWVMVASHNVRFLLHRQLRRVSVGPEGEVIVYYNPRRPQKSALIKPGPVGQWITVLIGVAPLALYVSRYGLPT